MQQTCNDIGWEPITSTEDPLPEPEPSEGDGGGRGDPRPEFDADARWPWGEVYQRKVLKLACTTPLLREAPGVFRARLFDHPPRRTIAEVLETFHTAHPSEHPSLETIDELLRERTRRLKPAMAQAVRDEWAAVEATDVPDPQAIRETVCQWARATAARQVILDGATALERGGDPAAILVQLQAAVAVGQEAAEAELPLIPASEFLAADFGKQDHLVPDVGLAPGGAGGLAGHGGAGKSLLFINIGVAWSRGRGPFAGSDALRPSRPLRVGLFLVEDPAAETQRRLAAILGEDKPEGLLLFPRTQSITLGGLRGEPDQEALAGLGRAIRRHRLDVVILEPLVYLHLSEENQSTEMVRWLRPLCETCAEAGAAVILGTHTGWAEDRPRGSTSFPAWCDFVLVLTKEKRPGGRELHTLRLQKANFAPPWQQDVSLVLDPRSYVFSVGDRTQVLCAPADLAAWVRDDLGGAWEGKVTDFYEAAAARFECNLRTAGDALRQAVAAKVLVREGWGKAASIRVP